MAVTSAAAVTLAGTGVKVVVEATVVIRNTSDITNFSTWKYELFEVLLRNYIQKY